MSEGAAPARPVPRLIPMRGIRIRTMQSWFKTGASEIALIPGMIAAEEKRRVVEADAWIKSHPQHARELSRQVEQGRYGNLAS